MVTKVTAVILIIAGLVGLVWGTVATVRGVVAARTATAALDQLGTGRFRGNDGTMLPGGALPMARNNLASTSSLQGGLMVLLSLALIGLGEILWTLSRLASAAVLSGSVVEERTPRL